MKTNRHNVILRIISERDIETQTELSEALQAEGFAVTQATISRDIKDLRLVKVQNEKGKTRYTVHTAQVSEMDINDRFRSLISQTAISVDFAENQVVFKTIPGGAQASAAAFDTMNLPEAIGTIAGDDTVLIIAKNKDAAVFICDKIRRAMQPQMGE